MDKRQAAQREFGSIGEQNMGAMMRNGLLAISLMILGGGMSACADGTSWKEEVLLHGGSDSLEGALLTPDVDGTSHVVAPTNGQSINAQNRSIRWVQPHRHLAVNDAANTGMWMEAA